MIVMITSRQMHRGREQYYSVFYENDGSNRSETDLSFGSRFRIIIYLREKNTYRSIGFINNINSKSSLRNRRHTITTKICNLSDRNPNFNYGYIITRGLKPRCYVYYMHSVRTYKYVFGFFSLRRCLNLIRIVIIMFYNMVSQLCKSFSRRRYCSPIISVPDSFFSESALFPFSLVVFHPSAVFVFFFGFPRGSLSLWLPSNYCPNIICFLSTLGVSKPLEFIYMYIYIYPYIRIILCLVR